MISEKHFLYCFDIIHSALENSSDILLEQNSSTVPGAGDHRANGEDEDLEEGASRQLDGHRKLYDDMEDRDRED